MGKLPPTSGRKNIPVQDRKVRLAKVTFGDSGDLGPVMIPVTSYNLTKCKRAQIIFEAQEFHTKGLFIQPHTNPRFLRALAQDSFSDLAPLQLQRHVVGRFGQMATESYFDRLEQALRRDAATTLKRTKAFLSVRVKKNRRGSEHNEFVATLPDNYSEDLVSELSDFVTPFFEKPTGKKRANFWVMYTKWIWTNQMAQAMCDLEEQIGAQRLENAAPEIARLTDWYLSEFASTLVQSLAAVPLEQLEVLLLLRRTDAGRLVVLADLGAEIDRVLRRPEEIRSVPSRRFKELMAYALSESGYDDVQLTPQTRDGGYDIEAIRRGPTRQRLIVECKRYDHTHKVGRPILDALLGVLTREKANQALLATTSSFSRDALELFQQEPWRLQGMDFENVMKLLRQARGIRSN